MSAYHSEQEERSGGERESTQSKRTEGQKGESGGESGGRILPIRWSNGKTQEKERIKKKKGRRKHVFPSVRPLEGFRRFGPHRELREPSRRND